MSSTDSTQAELRAGVDEIFDEHWPVHLFSRNGPKRDIAKEQLTQLITAYADERLRQRLEQLVDANTDPMMGVAVLCIAEGVIEMLGNSSGPDYKLPFHDEVVSGLDGLTVRGDE